MPQSSNDSSLFGAWPGGFLIAILLGLGAMGWVQAPLTPERPPESKEGLRSVGVQDVDARLWQDPFGAAIAARKARQEAKRAEPQCRTVEIGPDARTLQIRGDCPAKPGAAPAADIHDLGHLSGLIVARARDLGPKWAGVPGIKPVTVLGIMVSGGPSPSAAETRRRYRYAALSALMLEGFLPDDPEHVGYADLGKSGPPQIVPYEWFTRTSDATGHQALVLLWLDDDGLGAPEQPGANAATTAAPGAPRPLAHLSDLLTRLVPPEVTVGFQIIGPAGSGTLEAMAVEYRSRPLAPVPDAGATSPPGRSTRLWSPFATIPQDEPERAEPQRQGCPCGSPASGCVAVRPPSRTDRTIADDRELAHRLVVELGKRRVGGNAGIALVGQWDTAYSRTLAAQVEGAWRCAQAGPQAPGLDCAKASQSTAGEAIWVKRFSYMRGIDGAIPGSKPADKDPKAIERPGGDAQIDYLRRMRDALLAEDTRLRQVCGWTDRLRQRCGVRAIGVLGNDYFDKLLVLQALKPAFPHAVFFTTDLYADMLLPQDNPYTRNLVVASGFGLSLNPDWQREVPPLRDSYQSALLLTVRLAVQNTLGIPQGVRTPPPPRLFEIGRTRAVELVTADGRDDQGHFLRDGLAQNRDPHPADDLDAFFRLRPTGDPGIDQVALPLAAALLLGLGLAALGLRRARETAESWWAGLRSGWLPSAIAGSSLAASVGLLWLLSRDLAQGGEPFSLLEGVSVWPSEALRLIAGLIAVGLFIHGHRRQAEARAGIERDFPALVAGTPVPEPQGPAATSPNAGPCAGLAPLPQTEPVPATTLWTRYAAGCGLPQTLRRTWPEVLAFLLLAWTLMLTLGFPNRPTRSDLSWGLDLGIILLVLIPFLALLFFMVDATRQTLKLARDLRDPVTWPTATLDALGLGAWVPARDGQREGADLVWLDVCLIGAVTRPVGNLVWYPVLVLILIALARHPLFDAWALSPALILVMGLAIVYAVGCAWALRRAAEGVREEAVRQLSAALLRAQGAPQAKECLDPLRTMLAAVVAAKDGAFRPFSQQPVVRALLTLVSSVSGLALLEYSSLANL